MSIVLLAALLAGPAPRDVLHASAALEARAVLQAEGCQTDLPPTDLEAAPSTQRLALPRGKGGLSPGGGAAVRRALVWIFLAVLVLAALVGLFLLLLKLLGIRPVEAHATPPPAAPVQLAADAAARPSWEELARGGRFCEALRVLLGAAFALAAARGLVTMGPASTSRELLAQRSVPEHVRMPLAALVRAVERALFGGVPVVPADFAAAVAAYERMQSALQGS